MVDRLPKGQRWIDRPIVYDIGRVPPLDLEAFRLRITGRVGRPLELTWADILSLPCVSLTRDLHCVTTWSVKNVQWEGVRTRDLIDRANPEAGASWVLARSRDGYTASILLEVLRDPDSILAYRMNGTSLPAEHGAPLRLVLPALYAWKSSKYVEELHVSHELRRGYWEQRGYHDRGDPWREERFRS